VASSRGVGVVILVVVAGLVMGSLLGELLGGSTSQILYLTWEFSLAG